VRCSSPCLLSNPQEGTGHSPLGYAFSQGKRLLWRRHQTRLYWNTYFRNNKIYQGHLTCILLRKLMMHRLVYTQIVKQPTYLRNLAIFFPVDDKKKNWTGEAGNQRISKTAPASASLSCHFSQKSPVQF